MLNINENSNQNPSTVIKFTHPSIPEILTSNEISPKAKIIEVFGSYKDRENFYIWAKSNPVIVDENPQLSKVFKTLLKGPGDIISIDWNGKPNYQWIPPLVTKVKDLYSGKTDCFSAEGLEAILSCLNEGFFNLNDFISNKLHLKSEKYQTISKDDYEKLINNLKDLFNLLPISDAEKLKFLELIDFNKNQEQRTLLQYAKPHEIERIKQAYNDPILDTVVAQISQGEWTELLQAHGKNENIPFILFAAYCKNKISLDDLATAVIFHRVTVNSSSFEIHKVDANYLKGIQSFHEGVELPILEKLPENQKFILSFNKEALDEYTSKVCKSIFKQKVLGLFERASSYQMLSFGYLKALYKHFGLELVPILHLTPSFLKVANRLQHLKSDFALFLPNEKPVIHGSQDATIFSPMHDLFHATARLRSINYHQNMVQIIKRLIEEKKKFLANRTPFILIRPYQEKLASNIGTVNQTFKELPSRLEFDLFIIDRVIGEIIDGTYPIPTNSFGNNCGTILADLVPHVVQESFQNLHRNHLYPEYNRDDVLKDTTEWFIAQVLKDDSNL